MRTGVIQITLLSNADLGQDLRIRLHGVLISSDLSIPEHELVYRASRSGGPGGQHVNTSSTRIELVWDVAGSPSVTEVQRTRLLTKLQSRLDSSGQLRLVSSGSRSQLQNRREVAERFREIVAGALILPRPRKKTRPSRASKERRLETKKLQSAKKAQRRKPGDE